MCFICLCSIALWSQLLDRHEHSGRLAQGLHWERGCCFHSGWWYRKTASRSKTELCKFMKQKMRYHKINLRNKNFNKLSCVYHLRFLFIEKGVWYNLIYCMCIIYIIICTKKCKLYPLTNLVVYFLVIIQVEIVTCQWSQLLSEYSARLLNWSVTLLFFFIIFFYL